MGLTFVKCRWLQAVGATQTGSSERQLAGSHDGGRKEHGGSGEKASPV